MPYGVSYYIPACTTNRDIWDVIDRFFSEDDIIIVGFNLDADFRALATMYGPKKARNHDKDWSTATNGTARCDELDAEIRQGYGYKVIDIQNAIHRSIKPADDNPNQCLMY